MRRFITYLEHDGKKTIILIKDKNVNLILWWCNNGNKNFLQFMEIWDEIWTLKCIRICNALFVNLEIVDHLFLYIVCNKRKRNICDVMKYFMASSNIIIFYACTRRLRNVIRFKLVSKAPFFYSRQEEYVIGFDFLYCYHNVFADS